MRLEFGTEVLITDLEADAYLKRARNQERLKEKPEWPPFTPDNPDK